MLIVAVLLILVLVVTIILTIYNNNRLQAILEESVESELIASCVAARNEIDIDLFMSINSSQDFDANNQAIQKNILQLRTLQQGVGATYIYALKEIDGQFYFILDTDEEAGTLDNPIFDLYELSPVHEAAFAGQDSAGIMNVQDEWGSYNTGAIPIYHEHRIVGIVAVDFEDTYIARSRMTALLGTILLIAVIIIALGILFAFLIVALRRNQKMEEHLYRMSNYDAITGLLNRNFFFTYLSGWSRRHAPTDASFGLLFIDLDNFKSVNDKAGHDTGDDLLKAIATFLNDHTDIVNEKGGIYGLTARTGGDEFLQIIPDISTPEELEQHAQLMLKDFSEEAELQPFIKDYGVGLSIGGALFPLQTEDYNDLVKLADIAMYKSKFGGKNNYTLYDLSMGEGTADMALTVRTKKSR
ncbi:MAG: GGDEF domain-containing protein [Coriobacteriia bacterium]|nr:GGDEF domain-containing protein [Coriobacteriia bacterium]